MYTLEMMRVWMKNRKGQNTVEYLMMLGVIVGVILVLGMLFKGYLPNLFNLITSKINAAVSTSAS